MIDSTANSPSDWKKIILFISIAMMLAGLLFSRALLSSGLVVFTVICLVHREVYSQFKTFLSSPFLWAMSLLFLVPLISGLWSEDISQWLQIIRIKLPLLLLPVCFAGVMNFNFKNWEMVAFIFLTLVVAGVCWSLWQYSQNWESIHAGYFQAHTIETPLGNDHVRFSLLVAIAIVTSIFLWIKKSTDSDKTLSIILAIVSLIDIVYLHILAVRTGLICFYISLFAFIISLLKNSKHKLKYLLLLSLILILPFSSYLLFPTFKNRLSYMRYDLSFIRKNTYLPGSSDGDRFVSIKAGWELLNQKPFSGAGFGDIKSETNNFYERNYPQMKETDKILPSSEWMIYGSGVGWPGFIFFSFVMLIPFLLSR